MKLYRTNPRNVFLNWRLFIFPRACKFRKFCFGRMKQLPKLGRFATLPLTKQTNLDHLASCITYQSQASFARLFH